MTPDQLIPACLVICGLLGALAIFEDAPKRVRVGLWVLTALFIGPLLIRAWIALVIG